MQLKNKKGKNHCYRCKYFDDGYCKSRGAEIKSMFNGECERFEKKKKISKKARRKKNIMQKKANILIKDIKQHGIVSQYDKFTKELLRFSCYRGFSSCGYVDLTYNMKKGKFNITCNDMPEDVEEIVKRYKY